MESEGQQQQNAPNPSAVIAALLGKRAKQHEELRTIEKQVYDMETAYLQDPSQCGNVLKGYEGFLSASKSTSFYKRSRKFQVEDRLFSLSSVTSQATEEHAAMGAASTMGPGKPKKGRLGPRDVRRIRQYSEPDFDYEDDPDMI